MKLFCCCTKWLALVILFLRSRDIETAVKIGTERQEGFYCQVLTSLYKSNLCNLIPKEMRPCSDPTSIIRRVGALPLSVYCSFTYISLSTSKSGQWKFGFYSYKLCKTSVTNQTSKVFRNIFMMFVLTVSKKKKIWEVYDLPYSDVAVGSSARLTFRKPIILTCYSPFSRNSFKKNGNDFAASI